MSEKSQDRSTARPGVAARVLNWLRQGYPNGIPNHDTFALFYVLERELTEADLRELTEMIIAEGESTTLRPEPITREQIGRLILRIHAQAPLEEDITRIRDALKDAGFPVS
ncbi:DUF3349 domain-containing protein [Corynebacterium pacaense]|uniref:DUF3349 domain-containing protein n=1 Tax=Corynebacterium pacaense TaxID=1816684 RepID=UPI0009BB986A|nr:DUF3349 domain-containing protein [Corynebacterium pacaense]